MDEENDLPDGDEKKAIFPDPKVEQDVGYDHDPTPGNALQKFRWTREERPGKV